MTTGAHGAAPAVTSAEVERFALVAAEAAAAVGRILQDTGDWGESGLRAGQYRVDLAADRACGGLLHAAGFAVLSEESGLSGPPGAPLVVVDPLDGTTNASRGLPWSATALCLVDEVGARAAHVQRHPDGEAFTARRGEGAWRDGNRIAVPARRPLAASVVGVSGLPDRHPGWAQFRALGAAALDICAVATGALDAFCDLSPDAHGVWDYLAASLVCTEAGGVVEDRSGRELCVLDHAARRTPWAASSAGLLAALRAGTAGSPVASPG